MNEWTNAQSGFSDGQKNYPVRQIDMIRQSAAFPYTEEARKLTFRALALRRSESKNGGLCVVYIQKYAATLLIFIPGTGRIFSQLPLISFKRDKKHK